MSPAPFSPAALERELGSLIPHWPRCRLLVGFSGGADSMALLAALADLSHAAGGKLRRRGLELRALHVNHRIHPDSGAWARQARTFAARLRVPFSERRVRVLARSGESLEAQARELRYGALGASMRRGEVLVTAHHEEDQAETLLLQLLRGAGVAGLAAMPAIMPFATGALARPLLSVPRAALRHWASERGLSWIEDASNADERFDRNFLRHRVLPLLSERWPQSARVIARTARHLGEARTVLAELADLDLGGLEGGGTLDIERLQALSAPRQRNAVRRWLERHMLPLPDRVHLERVLGELCSARADAQPLVAWPGAEVRRWRGRLYCMQPLGPAPATLIWRPRREPKLALPSGLGSLVLVPDVRGAFAAGALPGELRVSFRAGGERLRTETGGPTRRLKELLRAGGVLPWMRDRLPLVHDGARLLAVGDLWRATGASRSRATLRLRIDWRDAPPVKSYSPPPGPPPPPGLRRER